MLGNRVITARSKRIAPHDAAQCKPAPAYCAMAFECLDRVRGTAWIITARCRQERRQRQLITANEQYQKRSHTRSLRERLVAGDTRVNRQHVRVQQADSCGVRLAPRPNGDVERRALPKRRQQLASHQLSQPALEPVSIHRGLLMSWNHDCHPRKRERGSEDSHVEMRSPNSLPLANDGLDVIAPRQTISTRKPQAGVRRLRTCSGA